MHAGGVVPAEEGLVGFFGVVAIEEVDDMGGDFLIDGFGAFECEGAFIVAHLVFGGAVGGFHPDDGARLRHANAILGIDLARGFRDAGDGNHFHGGDDGLLSRAAVDVGETDLLHGIEVIEVAPKFLEAVGGGE